MPPKINSITFPASLLADALRSAMQAEVAKLLASVDINDYVLITAEQGSKLLGLQIQTFRKLPIDRMDLGPRCTRWRLSDINAYLETRKVILRK
jgi:predicted DNA-binding transcriptional regulator AlpA